MNVPNFTTIHPIVEISVWTKVVDQQTEMPTMPSLEQHF